MSLWIQAVKTNKVSIKKRVIQMKSEEIQISAFKKQELLIFREGSSQKNNKIKIHKYKFKNPLPIKMSFKSKNHPLFLPLLDRIHKLKNNSRHKTSDKKSFK